LATYLFISVDLSVVEYLANGWRSYGQLVEMADTNAVVHYTQTPVHRSALSHPCRPGTASYRIVLKVTRLIPRTPGGCYHPRCRYAEAVCRTETPALRDQAAVYAACHFTPAGAVSPRPRSRRDGTRLLLAIEFLPHPD
jgi:ABC-type dipeptide/oligopeptide/nickel transport system ATPase component